MSNAKVKKRPSPKVSKISKTLNVSSGLLHANQSITKSSSTSFSRRSFSLTEDTKLVDKNFVQTPKYTVRDETGQDVTPMPLYLADPAVSQTKQGKLFSTHDTSWGTTTDFLSMAFQTNTSFAGPFTRSLFGSITASRASHSTAESLTNEAEDVTKNETNSFSDVQGRKEEAVEQVEEVPMDTVVDCYLTETETMWLLDIPAVSVSTDSINAEAVKERNKAYIELCKNRQGNDKYVERSMQTFNGAVKTKEVQCDTVTMVDKAVISTISDMYDSFGSRSGELGEDAATPFEGNKADVSDMSSVALKAHRKGSNRLYDQSVSMISIPSTGSDSSSCIEMEVPVPSGMEETDPELILQSDKFKHDLAVMERVVLENIFQTKLAAYRQLPVLEEVMGSKPNYAWLISCLFPVKYVQNRSSGTDPDYVWTEIMPEEESWTDQSLGPFLEHLWAFRCELTTGRNVSSMTWNKRNPDLLAVGYGQFEFKDQKSGLLCCWSLKNPTWPERIFHCDSGVTALDFSSYNVSQLAVGMYDGNISIYNIHSTEQTAIIDRSDSANMHTGPVWQLKWIDREKGRSGEDKEETLISVSADGRISKWFLRKGMKRTDLIKLRRTKERSEKSSKVNTPKNRCEVLISRLASGPCFDFHPKDSNIYLAGTEEGEIHKCSYSYNEQFLDTYQPHKGPVYKITWSPFSPDVFLSCSSDWTIQLWKQDLCTPVLSFMSGQKAVYDVVWSPHCDTVFGAVSESRVEIWDLTVSILDPVIVHLSSPGVKPSTLLFTPQTDCILVGDSEGQVSVYKLKNFTAGDITRVDALGDIIQSTLASHL